MSFAEVKPAVYQTVVLKTVVLPYFKLSTSCISNCKSAVFLSLVFQPVCCFSDCVCVRFQIVILSHLREVEEGLQSALSGCVMFQNGCTRLALTTANVWQGTRSVLLAPVSALQAITTPALPSPALTVSGQLYMPSCLHQAVFHLNVRSTGGL